MSRSYRKTSIHGISTARSESDDKKQWHSTMRSRESQRLRQLIDQDGHMTTDRREVSDPWGMAKDGKLYWDPRSQLAVAKRNTRSIAANDAKAVPRALHKFMAK